MPLIFSEYLRPWKLLTFAGGLVLLIAGAFHYQFQDWDVGISVIMAMLTYLFAPWSIRVLIERQWKWMPVALLAYWLTVDGSYVAYNEFFGHWYLREANFYASTCLYLLCGFIWLHRGPLRSIGKGPK